MRDIFPSGDIARHAGLVVGLASACLAVSINRTGLGQLLGIDLSWLGNAVILSAVIAFMALGGILIVLWIVGLFIRYAITAPARLVVLKLKKLEGRFGNLGVSLCTAADLEEVSRLSAAAFGPLAASLKRNQVLFKHDSKSYWKIQTNSGAIVGFYTVFRLTAAGIRAIKRGEFDITTSPTEYLRKDAKYYYKDIYIAGIYGTTKNARAVAWGALNQRALELRPKKIFARAATEDGLRLLEHAKFSPLQANKFGVGALYYH